MACFKHMLFCAPFHLSRLILLLDELAMSDSDENGLQEAMVSEIACFTALVARLYTRLLPGQASAHNDPTPTIHVTAPRSDKKRSVLGTAQFLRPTFCSLVSNLLPQMT